MQEGNFKNPGNKKCPESRYSNPGAKYLTGSAHQPCQFRTLLMRYCPGILACRPVFNQRFYIIYYIIPIEFVKCSTKNPPNFKSRSAGWRNKKAPHLRSGLGFFFFLFKNNLIYASVTFLGKSQFGQVLGLVAPPKQPCLVVASNSVKQKGHFNLEVLRATSPGCHFPRVCADIGSLCHKTLNLFLDSSAKPLRLWGNTGIDFFSNFSSFALP